MALLWWYGADTQVGWIAGEALNWDVGAMPATNEGRHGNQSNGWTGTLNEYNEKQSLSISGSIIVGFAVKVNAATQGVRDLLTLKSGSTVVLTVGLNAADKLTLYSGDLSTGTLLQTGSTALVAETWAYVEIKADIANGTAVVRLDNTVEINEASTGTTGSVNAVRWGYQTTKNNVGGDAGSTLFDDYYIADTSGTNDVNDFIGCSAAVYGWDADTPPIGAPNAAGTTTQWTPSSGSNYACVDEGASDNDASYVETSTAGHKDLYNFPDWPTSPSVVHSVRATLYARYNSTAGAVRSLAYHSGSTSNGATHTLGGSYAQFSDYFPLCPSTSAAWTSAQLNAAEFGIECVSGNPRVTLVRVEALLSNTSFAAAPTRRPNFVGFVGVP